LGGGVLPVSAVVADKAILGVFTPGVHGSTFGGNPLAAAVAIAALDVLDDENLAARAAELGERLRAGLRAIRCQKLVQVRGKGLLNATVFESGFQAWDVCVALKDHGLLAELEQAIAIIREVFEAI
jgi:ornithine--oxo-acid transaminase